MGFAIELIDVPTWNMPLKTMNSSLNDRLLSVFGIDLAFEVSTGAQGRKDAVETRSGDGLEAVGGPQALAQELQRLFDLTPVASFPDDLGYGIDWSFLGTAINPPVTCALARVAVLKALQHPSFQSRFKVEWVGANWYPHSPDAIYITAVLELFGYEGLGLVRIGPYIWQPLR